ncbi:hypothetical protein AAVH_42671, partial [Aphelenchoides avenae]
MELMHHIGESVVNSLSILFNLVLLYLIAFHSNFGTPVYQIMLAIDASLDLLLSIVVLIGQPICFTGGGHQVYISNGFFAGWNYTFDKFMIMMFNFTVLLNVMWIVIQFVYRYSFLCLQGSERKAERRRIYYILVAVCVLWVTTGASLIYVYNGKEQNREALELNHWDIARLPVVVGAHITNWRMKAWIAFWGVSCTTSMIVVGIFEMKIKRHFDTLEIVHENTRKIQKDFHRALLAMACFTLKTGF